MSLPLLLLGWACVPPHPTRSDDPARPEVRGGADTGEAEDSGEPVETGDTEETASEVETGSTITVDTSAPGPTECETREDICTDGVCVVDLPMGIHTVSGTLAVDGVPMAEELWMLYAVDAEHDAGRMVFTEGPNWSVDLPNGTWQLLCSTGIGEGPLAAGDGVELIRDLLVVGDQEHHIDVTSFEVAGTFTRDGTAQADFEVELVSTTGGLSWSTAAAGTAWSMRIPADTYDVYVESTDAADSMYGHAWRVAEDVTVSGDLTVPLALDTVLLSGTMAIEGEPEDRGVWSLDVYRQGTDDQVKLTPETEAWKLRVPVGTYDILRVGADDGGYLPDAVFYIAENLDASEDVDLPIDVQLLYAIGSMRANGEGLPDASYSLWFCGSGLAGCFGGTFDEPFWSIPLVAGTYDVWMGTDDPAIPLAPGGYARVATGVEVTADRVVDLELQSATVGGRVTFDGAAPTEGFHVTFTDRETGEVFEANPVGPEWSIVLPVGTYDVVTGDYGLDGPGDALWREFSLAEGWVIAGDDTLDADLLTWPVAGTLLRNGAEDTTANWYLYWTSLDHNVEEWTSAQSGAAWATRLPAGAWTARVWGPIEDDFAAPEFPVWVCIEVGN